MPEKVVIIGSGPAGWTAAIYAARANLQPLVYRGRRHRRRTSIKGTLPLGQLNLTTEVENFPTWPCADAAACAQFSKSALPAGSLRQLGSFYEGKQAHHGKRAANGPELMEFDAAAGRQLRHAHRHRRHRQGRFQAAPVRADVAATAQTVEALTVIVATGARANYLGLPSEDRFKNNGVSACAVCDGALPRFRNKPLVVVGGGDSAVEEATYLTKFASKVYLVHRRDELRASKIMQQRALSQPEDQHEVEPRRSTRCSAPTRTA